MLECRSLCPLHQTQIIPETAFKELTTGGIGIAATDEKESVAVVVKHGSGKHVGRVFSTIMPLLTR